MYVVSDESTIKKWKLDTALMENYSSTSEESFAITAYQSNNESHLYYADGYKVMHTINDKYSEAQTIAQCANPPTMIYHTPDYCNIFILCNQTIYIKYNSKKESSSEIKTTHTQPIIAIATDNNKHVFTLSKEGSLHITDFDGKGDIKQIALFTTPLPDYVHMKWYNDSLMVSGAKALMVVSNDKWELSLHSIFNSNEVIIGFCEVGDYMALATINKVLSIINKEGKEVQKYTSSNLIKKLGFSNGYLVFIDIAGLVGIWKLKSYNEHKNAESPVPMSSPVSDIEDKGNLSPIENEKEENDEAQETHCEIQKTFQPTQTAYNKSNIRILFWSCLGRILQRKETQFTAIDIEFADLSYHRNITREDVTIVDLASMGKCGAILCSKASDVNLDEYEDEEKVKLSYINFIPFHEWRGVKEWKLGLDEGESCEAAAVGDSWVAIYTDQLYVRFISQEGIQLHIISMAHSIVSMASYENSLAIIMTSGAPVQDNQNQKCIVYKLKSKLLLQSETDFPLSPSSSLSWIGFSSNGLLCSYDSNGIMRAFTSFYGNIWMPIYDHGKSESERSLYIIGVIESEILCIKLPTLQKEPNHDDKSLITTIKFKIPYLGNGVNESNDLFIDKLQIECNEMQIENHKNNKVSRFEETYIQTKAYLKEESAVIEAKRKYDKDILNLMRMALDAGEIEKSATLSELLFFKSSIEIGIKLANRMGITKAAERLEDKLGERNTRETKVAEPAIKRPLISTDQKAPRANEEDSNSTIGEKLRRDRIAMLYTDQSQTLVTDDMKNKSFKEQNFPTKQRKLILETSHSPESEQKSKPSIIEPSSKPADSIMNEPSSNPYNVFNAMAKSMNSNPFAMKDKKEKANPGNVSLFEDLSKVKRKIADVKDASEPISSKMMKK